jgi:hypothetical protein
MFMITPEDIMMSIMFHIVFMNFPSGSINFQSVSRVFLSTYSTFHQLHPKQWHLVSLRGDIGPCPSPQNMAGTYIYGILWQ